MASNAPLSQVECVKIFILLQKFNRIDNCICRGTNEFVGFTKLAGC